MPNRDSASKQPTLIDVATLAGVSAITVSRALRTPEVVSPQKRQRIEAAVSKLGYVPNSAASALASQQTDVIGLLVPSLTNNVFAEVLRGIYDQAGETRYNIQIGNYRFGPNSEERLIRTFLSQKPSGLIVAGMDQTDAAKTLLQNAPCPIVQIMDHVEDAVDMAVGFSHSAAAEMAVAHLLEQGYCRPAFLGARMDPRSQKRLAGFRAKTEAEGVFDANRVLTTPKPSRVGLGGELLAELLARAPDTDAVLCNNDDLAAGALFEAQRQGLNVPGALGICGFNDLEMSRHLNPSLTSINTNLYQIGEAAMGMLNSALEHKRPDRPTLDIPVKLMPRQSTAK